MIASAESGPFPSTVKVDLLHSVLRTSYLQRVPSETRIFLRLHAPPWVHSVGNGCTPLPTQEVPPFTAQRVLVVGAGTTAADICQDLHAHGARTVTMLQRTPTCVVSRAAADVEFAAWPEGVATEIADFRVAGAPLGFMSKIAKSGSERARRGELDGAMWDALEARGFRVTDGLSGGGRRELVYERLGGRCSVPSLPRLRASRFACAARLKISDILLIGYCGYRIASASMPRMTQLTDNSSIRVDRDRCWRGEAYCRRPHLSQVGH